MSQQCKATASSSGAFRARRLAQGHLNTPGIKLATLRLPTNPSEPHGARVPMDSQSPRSLRHQTEGVLGWRLPASAARFCSLLDVSIPAPIKFMIFSICERETQKHNPGSRLVLETSCDQTHNAEPGCTSPGVMTDNITRVHLPPVAHMVPPCCHSPRNNQSNKLYTQTNFQPFDGCVGQGGGVRREAVEGVDR